MQISLRSQLITGAVAVVGASAVAMTPIAAGGAELPGISSKSLPVALMANPLANPAYDFLTSMNLVALNFVDSVNHYGNGMLVGMIPQALADPVPVALQLGKNWTYYIGQAVLNILTSPTSTASGLVSYAWNAPAGLVEAAQQALSGNVPAAINTLYNTFIAPIPYIISPTVTAISTIVNGVLSNAMDVIGVIPGLLSGLGATTLAALQDLTATAVDITKTFIGQLTSFDLAGAWDTYWNKGWGASGFPLHMADLTIGGGIGNYGSPGYLPSFRVWGMGAINTIKDALDPFTSSSAAAKAAPAAAALAGTGGDESDGGGAGAPSGSGQGSDADDSGGVSGAADEGAGSSNDSDSNDGAAAGSDSTDGASVGNAAPGGSKSSGKGRHRAPEGGSVRSGGTVHAKAHGAHRRAS